jgi:hypothetical protein
MTIDDIIRELRNHPADELTRLNTALIAEIKVQRSAESQRKRFLFQSGDRVTWTGRKGIFVGNIERVKQKKALVKVGVMTWDVPLNMLNAV